MAKNLVIVESPAKVKTIKKFLGSGYEVTASQGHVRDLPKSSMGIDIDKDFEPKYITIRGKGEILSSLRKEVKKADNIYLATDPDREGEAISWHLYAALSLENKKCYRITFNEITKNAVKESLKHPREIDMNLVDAQQARRVIDRIVGYSISPVMWAKVKRGLSAGRVQSAALHMVCDRESEIDAFIPEEYWTLDAILNIKGEKKPLTAKYYGEGNDKAKLVSKADADRVMMLRLTSDGNAEKYDAEITKMYEQIKILREKLAEAKELSNASSPSKESELIERELSSISGFEKFDDLIVRKCVSCIKVNSDSTISVCLKTGNIISDEL